MGQEINKDNELKKSIEKIDALINLKNTYHAAMVMIDMDETLIKSNHAKDYHLFIEDLKKALDEYDKPFILSDKHNGGNQNLPKMTQLEKYLSDLRKASQNMFNILNEDGKTFVANYLKG